MNRKWIRRMLERLWPPARHRHRRKAAHRRRMGARLQSERRWWTNEASKYASRLAKVARIQQELISQTALDRRPKREAMIQLAIKLRSYLVVFLECRANAPPKYLPELEDIFAIRGVSLLHQIFCDGGTSVNLENAPYQLHALSSRCTHRGFGAGYMNTRDVTGPIVFDSLPGITVAADTFTFDTSRFFDPAKTIVPASLLDSRLFTYRDLTSSFEYSVRDILRLRHLWFEHLPVKNQGRSDERFVRFSNLIELWETGTPVKEYLIFFVVALMSSTLQCLAKHDPVVAMFTPKELAPLSMKVRGLVNSIKNPTCVLSGSDTPNSIELSSRPMTDGWTMSETRRHMAACDHDVLSPLIASYLAVIERRFSDPGGNVLGKIEFSLRDFPQAEELVRKGSAP